MSTNIRVEKVCQHCNKPFIAKTLITRYCGHLCNSRAYKARKKVEKLSALTEPVEQEQEQEQNQNQNKVLPRPTETYLQQIQDKQFLTVQEVAKLLRLSKATIYRLIKDEKIKAVQFSQRATRIKRTEIDKLF